MKYMGENLFTPLS